MVVLFCFYPLSVHYNHGISVLSAQCKAHGIETELLMLSDMAAFEEHVTGKQYAGICFSSVIERDFHLSVPFINRSKELGFTTIVGGVYPRRGLTLNCNADYICRGEGESLPLFFTHGDTRIFDTKQVSTTLPLGDYDLFCGIPFDRKIPGLDLGDKKVLPYYSSRGCHYKCTFCECQYQTGMVRIKRSVGRDLRELDNKYSPDCFFIGDELLPYYDKGWRESWDGYSKPFFAYIRADISGEQLDFLVDRGMFACAFGVESADEKYRNETLRKGLSDYDLFRTVERLNRHGVHYVPFFMTGTPGETFKQKAMTHKMSTELGGFPMVFQYENLLENVYRG